MMKKPKENLNGKEQVLHTKTSPLGMVLWENQMIEEATWESRDKKWKSDIHIFSGTHSCIKCRDQNFLKGARILTPKTTLHMQ